VLFASPLSLSVEAGGIWEAPFCGAVLYEVVVVYLKRTSMLYSCSF
jgi:hypothetical protein